MEDSEIVRSKDPNLLASRIYIGNWPADRSRMELAEHFKKYGPVLGTFIHEKGYAFLQFADVRCAVDAIARETHSTTFGRRLDIRLAKDGGKDGASGAQKSTPATVPAAGLPSLFYSPAFDRPLFPQGPSLDAAPPSMGLSGLGMLPQGRMYSPFAATPIRRPDSPTHFVRPGSHDLYAHELMARRELPPVNARPLSPAQDIGPPPAKKNDTGYERPFDAAIIFSHTNLRIYAEMVERRLMELNLTVDVIFILESDKDTKVVEAMAKRGILYVVLVQPQHENHKSVTVNILHGTPQEHRNIPLDDALVMLARDSNAYLSNLRAGSELPSISFLTHLLSNGKNLSRPELDRIIDHLQDRRDRIIRAEGAIQVEKVEPVKVVTPVPTSPAIMTPPKATPPQPHIPVNASKLEQASKSSSQELHQKILSILGGGLGPKDGEATLSNIMNLSPETIAHNLSTAQNIATAQEANDSGGKPSSFKQINEQSEPAKQTNMNPAKPAPNLFPGNLEKTLQNLMQNPESLRNLMSSTQKSGTTTNTTSSVNTSIQNTNQQVQNPPPQQEQNGRTWKNNSPIPPPNQQSNPNPREGSVSGMQSVQTTNYKGPNIPPAQQNNNKGPKNPQQPVNLQSSHKPPAQQNIYQSQKNPPHHQGNYMEVDGDEDLVHMRGPPVNDMPRGGHFQGGGDRRGLLDNRRGPPEDFRGHHGHGDGFRGTPLNKFGGPPHKEYFDGPPDDYCGPEFGNNPPSYPDRSGPGPPMGGPPLNDCYGPKGGARPGPRGPPQFDRGAPYGHRPFDRYNDGY